MNNRMSGKEKLFTKPHAYGKPKAQKGLVLVLVTAALVALAGVMALAIDVNHAFVNKTRLQNGVDAAALAAALVLDSGGSDADATAMVNSTLTKMATSTGNQAMDFSAATISVTFSNDPETFPDPGYSSLIDDRFVRVAVSNYPLNAFFIAAFGINKNLAASAVAGPGSSSTQICNVVPMAVCAGSGGGTTGYVAGDLYPLKVASKNQSSLGPGNYQLLDFGSGASAVRSALAGGYTGCLAIGDTVTTKPGNTVGPVGQGLNTRFGVYGGGGVNSSDYPPDIYVKEPDTLATLDNDGNVVYTDTWGYDDYELEAPNCSGADCYLNSGGEPNRRMLSVPIVDCSGASGGTTTLQVEALGCFFLLQQAPTSNSGKQAVFGEYVEECSVTNSSSGNVSSGEGPYRIVLYDDPLSEES
ncbi:pilus assembly protein TadG-related protein [Vibrio quintilis]|nr:pilus assembly protein TadG-related protein [Vibrio quintilis]